MRAARRDLLIAGQTRKALEVYRAKLLRGEQPETTTEVFAALVLEGLANGNNIMFADEVAELERKRKQQAKRK